MRDLVTSDGWVYIRINKVVYGLRNAAILAYNILKRKLAPFGYSPVEGTVGLWAHKTKRTRFGLCVDDFGIQYHSKDDANHLLRAVSSNYIITLLIGLALTTAV